MIIQTNVRSKVITADMKIALVDLTRSVAEGRSDDFFLNDASQITIQ